MVSFRDKIMTEISWFLSLKATKEYSYLIKLRLIAEEVTDEIPNMSAGFKTTAQQESYRENEGNSGLGKL